MARTCKELRAEFVRFFEQKGHRNIISSPLLPADDPTLLFANAGMNQFKPIFLGTETREYSRAVNTQKCIRAGGKHNDLEDVGRDCYHHTFFEMLGNWSFGDYFKKEAIAWAWELLTGVWGIDKTRLHATYFEGDESFFFFKQKTAYEIWKKYLPDDHIHPGNKKDNFWEMGDTGPCGPCTEIHIDLTPDKSGSHLVNAGNPSVMEIWNLVFMQFNRDAAGRLSPLPAKHVDTGMGLERLGMVIQGKRSNYATDLFVPVLEFIETLTAHRYGVASVAGGGDRFDTMNEKDLGDVAMRVIADHARALTFAIADGILPSNDGRGSVLRAILRRAAGFGRQHLKIQGAFLYRIVPVIVKNMGDAFPEIVKRAAYVADVVRDEEESFGRTLDRGLELFNRHADRILADGGKVVPAEVSFELHATYGFPFSLTKLMAEKRGLSVDENEHIAMMEEHRRASSAGADKFHADAIIGLPETQDDEKYKSTAIDATVLGWVKGDKYITDGFIETGDKAALVLDRTCFYAECGGQVGDEGTIITTDDGGVVFHVTATKPAGSCVLHFGELLSGRIAAGTLVLAEVDGHRMDTMRNHSATHMLNWALRKVLRDDNVQQAGSVVDSERLRFDFTWPRAVTPEQLAEVEKWVNWKILADQPITVEIIPLDVARKISGVRAVFGEKYPDPVRVVAMGTDDVLGDIDAENCSVEFCGGTHLSRTSQVGMFKILSEESVAKGVRRITAVTGQGAVKWAQRTDVALRSACGVLKTSADELSQRIEAMQLEIKKLRKRPAVAAAAGGETELSGFQTSAGMVVVADAGVCDPAAMRNICDQQRQKGAVAVFLGSADADEGKVTLIAMVDDAVVKAGKAKAGDWVKEIAPIVGGGGGGKPNLAQAGGKHPEKLADALAAAKNWIQKKLG